jgi:outer membrane protein
MEKKLAGFLCFLLFAVYAANAQPRTLTLDEAVQLGIQNSKQLKLSAQKIQEAQTRLAQAKDNYLPSATVSFQYLHALMLSRVIEIPGVTQNPLKLPFDFPAYLGTASVNEPIWNGNKLRYAKQSADIMVQLSKIDAEKDQEDVIYLVISSYFNYDEILENQLIVAQNMQDVESKLEQITKYESQGLATQNDVLRYQLQKSQQQITEVELENNRQVANYNLNILLGLPDSTQIILPALTYKTNESFVLGDLITLAEANRRELQDLSYQTRISDINVKKIRDGRLPTFSATGGMYYINPTGEVIPTHNNLIAPITLGVGASWDIGTLYKNKNKEAEANIQRRELNTEREQYLDDIHEDVHKQLVAYNTQLAKIKLLQVAVEQAQENERITESKYQNNLVTTTDRIDAQSQLYQARIQLQLAQSDASIDYYNVLRSTGKIHL